MGCVGSTDVTVVVADIDDQVIIFLTEMLVLAAGMGENGFATLPQGWSGGEPTVLGDYTACASLDSSMVGR
jgi:hypothetical protein